MQRRSQLGALALVHLAWFSASCTFDRAGVPVNALADATSSGDATSGTDATTIRRVVLVFMDISLTEGAWGHSLSQ